MSAEARDAIAAQHRSHPVFEQSLSTVIEGDRRVFAVTDFAGADGSAGLACDTSAIEAVRGEYERTVRSHADTLDQLNTAVAIFDIDEKLRFFNQAFQKLWGLDIGFLHSAPDNALLLDRLRSEGKIAEQPEWRRWKESLLGAYRAVESQEHWWHLPDGKTIRVVANPQPKGGVTWVFENLTEKMDLESRYQTAVRVQGETLDNLAEGVAVFGPDGRLRLSNPAFAKLWGLSAEAARAPVAITAASKNSSDPPARSRTLSSSAVTDSTGVSRRTWTPCSRKRPSSLIGKVKMPPASPNMAPPPTPNGSSSPSALRRKASPESCLEPLLWP